MINIMAFPRGGDSYTDCFYSALEKLGVRVHTGVFAGRWLLQNLRDIDYIHIHWPSFFYNDARPLVCIRRFMTFLFLLGIAHWRGARLIWTVHNLYPHDRCTLAFLDKIARWIVTHVGKWFLVHGKAAEREVVRKFPAVRGKTIRIDHRHWIDYFPNNIQQREARELLGLAPDAYTFLFIGLCKPYKNLEGLIEAYTQLGRSATLLIAGKFQTEAYETRIRALVQQANASGSVHLRVGFIPDEELQVYLNAADVVVAPYLDILTSGTAMLAFSFGKPLIGPAKGFLRDVVIEGTGVLYDPKRGQSLREAMLSAMDRGFNRSDILAHARKFSWVRSSQELLEELTLQDDEGYGTTSAEMQRANESSAE